MYSMHKKMTKKQVHTHFSTSSSLSIHQDSHSIFKAKPKIRIIHIFSPEIIKTDVANFRELVQTLTGKPTEENACNKVKMTTKLPRRESEEEPKSTLLTEINVDNFKTDGTRDRVLEEEEGMCFTENNSISSEFLDRFADLEGFIQELGDEFPFLPLDTNCFMHEYEGTHQLSTT